MIDVIVDSSVWIEMERAMQTPHASTLRRLIDAGAIIGITDVIYAELRAGSAPPPWLDRLADGGRVLGLWELDDYDRAAECMRASIHAGRRVRTIADCMVASVCIREELPLLHHDSDFDTLASCTELQVVPV